MRPVWVGNGWLQDQYQREARTIVGSAGVWVPPPAHIGDAYQALDCFVLASPNEGFALSIAEAMLCGVPVVCTRVGFVPGVLERWGDVVVTVDDEPTGDQLAEAIQQAMSEANRPNVRRARQVVWEEFTAARMASRWADYLQRIMNEQAAQRRAA